MKTNPRNPIITIAEVEALIKQAKATGEKIPVYHYDSGDGTYLPRFITAESFIDDSGLNYFDRNGDRCRTGPTFVRGISWFLYDNYWFLYAHALRDGYQLKEYIFA